MRFLATMRGIALNHWRMAAIGLSGIGAVGCVHHHHHDYDDRRGVVIVDERGYRHEGYYDDRRRWHGGYYDDRREFHEDAPEWRYERR